MLYFELSSSFRYRFFKIGNDLVVDLIRSERGQKKASCFGNHYTAVFQMTSMIANRPYLKRRSTSKEIMDPMTMSPISWEVNTIWREVVQQLSIKIQ